MIARALLLAALAGPAIAQIESSTLEPLEGTEEGQERPGFKRVFRPIGPQLPDRIDDLEGEDRLGAEIRQLDKMTGATETFSIAAGGRAEAGRLTIELARCLSPAENAPRGTRAYLIIHDTKHPGSPPAFEGWMFAESPALSALDHPRYDVWVISCTTRSGETASGSE